MGEGSSAILQHASKITIAKCLTGSEQLCYTLKQYNPSILTIFRPLSRNCPTLEEWRDSNLWWSYIKPQLVPQFDLYEVMNECAPPDNDYELYTDWMIEIAKLALQDHKVILGFSFGPGNPEFPAWDSILKYLRWSDSLNDVHPGLAFHASAFVPWATNNWLNNPYVAGRYRLIVQRLKDYFNYDLSKFKGEIVVTELGVEDGYSGNWNDKFTCEQKVQAYKETTYQYNKDGISFVWWNLGKLSIWADDSECLEEMLND